MPINAEYRGPGELPEIIPVFPLPGALLLPRGQMPLNIFEPRYLAMVDDCLRDSHRLIGMTTPDRPENTVDPKLLEILVCPLSRGPLEFDAARQELISRSAKLAYPIRDGIPIMV